MRLVSGHIIVKFDDTIISTTNSGMRYDPNFDPEFHQCVTGTVTEVCSTKTTTRDEHSGVPIDCKVGDRVAMLYGHCQTALECGIDNNNNGTWFIQDGFFHAYIHYSAVICFERDGVLKAAPGYCIAKQVPSETTIAGMNVAMREDEFVKNTFEVVDLGVDIEWANNKKFVGGVKPGDIVLTENACDALIESPEHLKLLPCPMVYFEKYLICAISTSR